MSRRTIANDSLLIADSEIHYLDATEVGDEFKIFIGHCGSIESDEPVPVLYVTDANGAFGTAVDIVRAMQHTMFLPPMLIVGIGYRLGALGETVGIRARDLTPSHDPDWVRFAPNQPESGGAPAFLAFIRNELQPWVNERYDVDPADATFSGFSFGGLFGAHVLLTEPSTFARYILGSPSLWWHDDHSFELELAYAAAHEDLDARVFFGIGGLETHEGRMLESSRQPPKLRAQLDRRYLDMVGDLHRFVWALKGRRYPSLVVEDVLVLPDEFHCTAGATVLSRGLRALFDSPSGQAHGSRGLDWRL